MTSVAQSVGRTVLGARVDISRAFMYRCPHVSTPSDSPPPPPNRNPVD